jgi:MOSC domain-containing protein YiiM
MTGIFKEPVPGRIAMRTLNLDGDRQADLSVHGGVYKAVYCYPAGHYGYWARELQQRDLGPGSFGENLTIDGLTEDAVHLGDRLSVGSAEIVVTQPRLPCFKLGIRFQSDDMIRRFRASGRPGFYVAVVREGDVGAGDQVRVVARDANAVSVREINRLHDATSFSPQDLAIVERALRVEALPPGWKDHFRERLVKMRA